MVEWRSRLSRYRGAIPRINAAVLVDIGQAQPGSTGWRGASPRGAVAGPSGRAPGMPRPSWTWLRRNTVTASARALLQLARRGRVGGGPRAMSPSFTCSSTPRSAGGFDDLVGTEGGAQQDRFVGGSQELAVRLAEGLGDVLEPGQPRSAGSSSGAMRFASSPRAARSRRGRRSSRFPRPCARESPTSQRCRRSATNSLSEWRREAWSSAWPSTTARSGATRAQRTGDQRRGSGEGGVRQLAARWVPGVLLGFLEGRQARELAQWSEDGAGASGGRLLRAAVRARRRSPTAYLEQVWAQEEFTRGCYGC